MDNSKTIGFAPLLDDICKEEIIFCSSFQHPCCLFSLLFAIYKFLCTQNRVFGYRNKPGRSSSCFPTSGAALSCQCFINVPKGNTRGQYTCGPSRYFRDRHHTARCGSRSLELIPLQSDFRQFRLPHLASHGEEILR